VNPLEKQLDYPFDEQLPDPGGRLKIAEGVYWLRMPLPFALNHINLWLLRDRHDGRDGWTVVDTGAGLADTRALWEQVITDHLEGLPIVRVMCTHMHPDHFGNAGWLTGRFDAPLWITQGEYTMGRLLQAGMPGANSAGVLRHFVANGMTEPKHLAYLGERGNHFPSLVPEVALAYRRIFPGERIAIGDDVWRVIPGYGHSPEHAAFYAERKGILISGDMLLPRISTNVSVQMMEPEANPLQWFTDSLRTFLPLPDDTLVLPAHGKPFRKLQVRVQQLLDHHTERLAEARELCQEKPTTAADVVPVMFRRPLDSHQIFFAFGEALAHLHQLWYAGEVRRERGADNVFRFRAKQVA